MGPPIEESIAPSETVEGTVEGIGSIGELEPGGQTSITDYYEVEVDGPGQLVIESSAGSGTVVGSVILPSDETKLFASAGTGIDEDLDNAVTVYKAGTHLVQIGTIGSADYSVTINFQPADDDATDGENETPTETPTATPTATPTDTPTATPTDTPTETPEDTPTATPTDTPESTPEDTPTDTPESTPDDTPTAVADDGSDTSDTDGDNGTAADETTGDESETETDTESETVSNDEKTPC